MAVLFLSKNIRACTFLVLRVTYTLSLSLHCAAKCLYELCFEGFLCLTKTSKRAVHGAISPLTCVHAGEFLRFMRIILQTLNSCAIRPPDSTACPHHRLMPLTLRYNVLVLTCDSDGTVLTACTWEAQNLHCFPLDTLNSPEGMQCVLKKIMNCHEVPYSLITKKPRHIHNLSVHGLGADFIIS